MSNYIHVLSSYKGGAGKTLIAASIAHEAIERGDNVIIIDTNAQNPNLAEDLFFYFHVHRHNKSPGIIGGDSTIYTISPSSNITFTVYNAVDKNPFELAKQLQKEDITNTTFIIDTNMHIRECEKGMFSDGSGFHKVFIWFLWGWSSPRLDHQLNAILNSTRDIERGFPNTQVIHVFNLYDFFTGGITGLSIRKTNITLKPLKKVLREIDKRMKKLRKGKSNSVYVGHKTLSKILKQLHTTLLRYIAPDDINMDELPSLWSSHLMDLLKTADNDYIYNILLIPTFFRELTMSTDRLIMSSPRSWKKIIEQIKPMADYIKIFASVLSECVLVDKICNRPVEKKTKKSKTVKKRKKKPSKPSV